MPWHRQRPGGGERSMLITFCWGGGECWVNWGRRRQLVGSWWGRTLRGEARRGAEGQARAACGDLWSDPRVWARACGVVSVLYCCLGKLSGPARRSFPHATSCPPVLEPCCRRVLLFPSSTHHHAHMQMHICTCTQKSICMRRSTRTHKCVHTHPSFAVSPAHLQYLHVVHEPRHYNVPPPVAVQVSNHWGRIHRG